VLKEFVASWKRASDPVERFGDEAVLGAAARALCTTLDDEVYPMLAAVARLHPLSEVIEALGYFRRAESIPILVAALEDDFARPSAEQAFKNQRRVGQAEIELPGEILRHGLHFIDTPGLGSAIVANTETTERFLPEIDAAIFVSSFDFALSEADIEFLRRVRATVGVVFFVLNKIGSRLGVRARRSREIRTRAARS
jgi:hypothetical protein